ncbi:MAG: PKD domain-containing protein [Bacteroidia bacterium]|nr:PKD domain-containing protein [Bacteroidia bacterium]
MRSVIFTIITLAFGLISESGYAQIMKVVPLDYMSGRTLINPVVVDSMLYFSSNMSNSYLVRYIDEGGKDLYHIYRVPLKNRRPKGATELYLTNASKKLNQVAIAFDKSGKIYVTENNEGVESRRGRVLGIKSYSDATAMDGKVSLKHEDMSNNAYMSIAPDGSYMVFASDRKGGKGSSDLYWCERKGSGWSQPINMGAEINTKGAETSPYIHSSGKIFFASNGHEGSNRLDLYYTYKTDKGFSKPKRVETGINSKGDDYGLFLSDDEKWGFLTSNRQGKDKIYYFVEDFPEFPNAEEYEEDNFCYTFTEESAQYYDAEQYDFKWSFSDGGVEMGLEVDHCFAIEGDYDIQLGVLDKVSGEELFNIAEYSLNLVRKEQLLITAPEIIKAGEEVVFDVDASAITSFAPKSFYWSISNGTKLKGKQAKLSFDKPGTYKVECGTMSTADSKARVATYIMVEVE